MTYLLFIRGSDKLGNQKEAKANLLKTPIEEPIYQPDENELRWSYFQKHGSRSHASHLHEK